MKDSLLESSQRLPLLPCDWPEASCNVGPVIAMMGHRPFLM